MRALAILILAALATPVEADILHLRDGSRYQGELVSQDTQEIVFRIQLPDGPANIVMRFDAAAVERVERQLDPPPERPPDSRPATPAQPPEHFEQMMREALELLADDDLPAALRALQRTVLESPPALHVRLDKACRDKTGMALAELLADVRIRFALSGQGFRIRFATHAERPALGRMLAQRHQELLSGKYHGRTLAEWARNPEAYEHLQPDAREMVGAARRAAGMLGARLKYDPQLREDRETRVELSELRQALARLVDRVTAMRGYTDLPDETGPAVPVFQPAAGTDESNQSAPPEEP